MTDRMSLNPPELLPCPFCGGDADLSFDKGHHPTWWKVTCIDCGCRTQTNTTDQNRAIAAWNTRASLCVKPLVWQDLGAALARAPAPLFGNIRVEKYSDNFTVAWSVPGYTDTFAPGEFATKDDAKAAAQAHYEACILSALTLKPASPWRGIDSAPLTDEFIGFWQYMYPGDKARTCGYSICEMRPDGNVYDTIEGGLHNPGLFTHWMPLPAPPEGGEWVDLK